METISVVVPCYNEVEAIPLFYREICSSYSYTTTICCSIITSSNSFTI